MKRVRRIIHIGLIGTTICLLAVDPAAACRLLAGRCRCCCCAPVVCGSATNLPAAEAESTPAEVILPQASPSDHPQPQAASTPAADTADVVAPAPVESGPEPLRSSNLPPSAPMPTDIAQPITVEQNTAATPKSAELSPPTAVAPVSGATRQPMPETPMAPE